MYQIMLTEEQQQELNQRAHQVGVAPSTRDRLEMLRLNNVGWHVPQIAKHLHQHKYTVRRWLKTFLRGGFNALINKSPPGKRPIVTPEILKEVHQEVAKAERTWTAEQITDWVAEHHGVRISSDRMRIHLKRSGLSFQRSSYSIDHKQKPEEVQDMKASLMTLEKGGTPD